MKRASIRLWVGYKERTLSLLRLRLIWLEFQISTASRITSTNVQLGLATLVGAKRGRLERPLRKMRRCPVLWNLVKTMGGRRETEKTNQARGVAERKGETRIRIRKRRMIRRRTGRASRTSRTRRARRTRRTRRTGTTRIRRKRMVGGTRTRRAAVERAPTCCLSLFTTSSGASTWPWNRHLRSVSKTSSITEINRGTGHLNRYGRRKLVVQSY